MPKLYRDIHFDVKIHITYVFISVMTNVILASNFVLLFISGYITSCTYIFTSKPKSDRWINDFFGL